MSDGAASAPILTPPPVLEFEHAYYIGNYLSGILYGVELVMYFMSMHALSQSSARSSGQKTFLMIFSTIMLLLLTIDISTNAVWGEQMWITFRDQPGGVLAYLEFHLTDWYEILGTASVELMILMGDAFIIYRCFIIWGSKWWVIVFPILMWCGTLALGVCQLIASAVPGGNFFGGKAINFGIPYYTLSIAQNVIVTSLIIGRILYISKMLERTLGSPRARIYTNVMAVMVESALPYALIGFMTIIPYGMGDNTSIAFGQVYAKFTCLAPQFIVLRVARGIAWDRNVSSGNTLGSSSYDHEKQSHTLHSTANTTMAFANRSQTGSQGSVKGSFTKM